ncbi:hypothetical protein KC363_g1173 [Hortaea werneckii]|uniref:AB hydrolase-1 domain-containing protein n=1 Tax=Hortaea werneckii TaxID=91943 RepID=A0A3M7FYD7_HORWE|nr:hypothetical protein KC363_g1173 [Hortaea werneckii]RMY93882.1 hypothetical protein D0861_01640 [Hortaea werneckii]
MAKPPPPPLPPRQSSSSIPPPSPTPDEAPPAYTDVATEDTLTLHHPSLDGADADAGPWQLSSDPRSSSTQSLVPSESGSHDSRRRLLLIFIHGFMGDETSFRSFPAHLHRLLTVLVAETHTVHTKIYPRYRSKRSITVARDDFSRWLEPHEDENTDVVLFGHSMGGLLAAEVVLLPPPPPASRPFKHRILGTINFDVPFLGMHPGVVRSGLASIFKPGEEPEDKYSPGTSPGLAADGSTSGPMRTDTLWDPGNDDPNFNPQFNNDVVLPVRKGWRNAWHFVNKHSGNLRTATKQLVTNHMEFGGAMANYGELKVRYSRVRALEEENQMVRDSVGRGRKGVPRVRFSNYYTTSSGRAKPKKEMKSPKSEARDVVEGPGEALVTPTSLERDDGENGKQGGLHSEGLKVEKSPSPRISVEEHKDDGAVLHKDAEQASGARDFDKNDLSEEDDEWQDAAESLTLHSPPSAKHRRSSTNGASGASLSPQSTRKSSHRVSSEDGGREEEGAEASALPPLPEPPTAPPPLDLTFIQDAETRKRVEKEHARAMKAYEKAVKEREKAVASRAKWQAKRSKSTQKDAERAEKEAEKAKKRSEKEEEKRKKKEAGKGKGVKKVQKPESEMTHQEKEERRLAAERLRTENEARRMRGEPPLPEEDEGEQEADEEQPLTIPDHAEQHGPNAPSSPPRTPSSSSSELPIVDNAPSPIPLAPSPVISHTADQIGNPNIVTGDNQQKGKMQEFHLPEPAAPLPTSPPLPPREPSLTPSAATTTATTGTSTPTPMAGDEKKQSPKEHKFCLLPPKDSQGERDPAWIRVWMEGVDEVGAHCGLFFVDERYERLVGDVGERVEGWVKESYGSGGGGDVGGGFGGRDEKRG